jgi:hypothetical protein
VSAVTSTSSTPSAGKLVFLALGLVVGACSGAAVAWVVQKRARDAYEGKLAALGPEAQPASRQAQPAPLASGSELDDSNRGAATRTEAAEQPRTAAPGGAGPDPLDEIVRAFGRAGIARGWARERHDVISEEEMQSGLEQFAATVRARPEGIGIDLARQRTAREHAHRDIDAFDILGLLGTLAERNAHLGVQTDVVRDAGSFARFFQRRAPETFVEVAADKKSRGRELHDGSTLRFPAGVFRLDDLFDTKPFPSDVTVAGAGMDATLLVVGGFRQPSSAVTRLGFRDCTMRTMDGEAFVGLRGGPGSFVLDHVRFVGFDGGKRWGCFTGEEHGLAVQARACRFEGGYGRDPSSATLLTRGSDALLARFDQCRFELMALDVQQWPAGATALFADCSLVDLLDTPPLIARPIDHPGIELQECTTTYFGADLHRLPKKDLNALFPDWEKRIR